MSKAPKKVPIAEREGHSRTAHLLPLIAFLEAQGNPPHPIPPYLVAGENGFYFDRDGLGDFTFEQPLDLAGLAAHFELPDTIKLAKTSVYDARNFVRISQLIPQGPPITFDF
jgi:hypothetical protein